MESKDTTSKVEEQGHSKLIVENLLITQYNTDNQLIKQKPLTILKRVSLSEIVKYDSGA